MAILTSTQSRQCATCAFWGGSRRAQGQSVAYVGSGVCRSPKALKNGQAMLGNFTGHCPQYTHWTGK